MACWPRKSSKRPWYLIDLDDIIYLLIYKRSLFLFNYEMCIIIFNNVLLQFWQHPLLRWSISRISASWVCSACRFSSQQHKKQVLFCYVTETLSNKRLMSTIDRTSSTTIFRAWLCLMLVSRILKRNGRHLVFQKQHIDNSTSDDIQVIGKRARSRGRQENCCTNIKEG